MKKKIPYWRDTSSYSQSDKVREPNSFTLGDNHQKAIVVHRWHHDPGWWYVTCYALRVDTPRRLTEELEESKKLAIQLACAELDKLITYYANLGVRPSG